jgi:transcriptional regulator with XRE-family HTH domain
MGEFGSGHGRGTGKPSPVDVYIGARVRMRRAFLDMSQATLGEAIGLSGQQVQKYERGANRLGSSRLYDLSRALDVPVEFFFEEMPAAVAAGSPGQGRYELDPMAEQETLELVRAYYKISNPQVRKRLFEVVKVIGATFENQDE